MNKKITVWAVAYCYNGVNILFCVSAFDKRHAIDKLIEAGYEIRDENHIRQICMVEAPGPSVVQAMEEKEWELECKPIQRKEP